MKNNIVSVTDPEDMEVPYGTEITAEDLPKTLPVQLEGDVQKDLEVTWDLSSYNPEEEGVQTITGTFAETDLIGNPDKVQAEVSVTVLPLHAKYKVTVENGSGSERSFAVLRKIASSPTAMKAADGSSAYSLTVFMIISGEVPEGSPIDSTAYLFIYRVYHPAAFLVIRQSSDSGRMLHYPIPSSMRYHLQYVARR